MDWFTAVALQVFGLPFTFKNNRGPAAPLYLLGDSMMNKERFGKQYNKYNIIGLISQYKFSPNTTVLIFS